jgi:hypothetical protein
MKKAASGRAAFVGIFLVMVLACRNEPQASISPQKSTPAIERPAPPPTEPVVFVPPKPIDAVDTVAALKEADARFKDYTLAKTRPQIELRDVSVTILDKMDVFAEPITSSTPGRFEFGGQDRTLIPEERSKVTEEYRKSVTAYLMKRLRVSQGARFELVIIVLGGQHRNQVHIVHGEPYGIETFRTLLLDTQSKSIVWCSGMDGWGKTLDEATKFVLQGVPEELDLLFGFKKQGTDN